MITIQSVLEMADFDEQGMVSQLKFDWETFDISHDDYFFATNNPQHPQAKIIDKMLERIYMAVSQKCNESKEYTIDCWKGRYTVRKIDEIEAIHYADMTDEEKAQHDKSKKLEQLYNELGTAQNLLSSSDYITTKLNECLATGTEEELAEMKEKYADTLEKRKQARVDINRLEKEIEELEK